MAISDRYHNRTPLGGQLTKLYFLSNYSLFMGFLILYGHLVFSYRHRMFASEPYLTFPFQFFFDFTFRGLGEN